MATKSVRRYPSQVFCRHPLQRSAALPGASIKTKMSHYFGRAFLMTVALLTCLAPAVRGQAGTIVGRTLDAQGAAVADVSILLEPSGVAGTTRTTVSASTGTFRLPDLASGSYTLRTSRLGFASLERQVSVAPGQTVTLELVLSPQVVEIEGITARAVQADNRERDRFLNESGITARVIEANALRTLPGLAETDVLRAVSLLPGVVSTSDFSSSYNVRGGSADQNLILIDGFTVFNPFHLGGLFSVFNADAVERAELFAGGFGAEYGGRVSSVLNIESRSDIPSGLEASGGISLLAARLLLRAPLPSAVTGLFGGDEGAWFISGRRSYFDQVLRPVAEFPYHLTDLQARISTNTASGGTLSFTGYFGNDVLDLSDFGLNDDDDGDEGSGNDATDVLRLRWNWGNQVAGIRLLQPIGSEWIADARVGYSRFAERLTFEDFGDVRFESGIRQAMSRLDLTRGLAGSSELRIGAALDRLSHENLAEAGGTSFYASDGSGYLGAGYATLRLRPTDRWIIDAGTRYDAWYSENGDRSVVSPRLSAKRFLGPGDGFAVKLAVGRYSQFLHSLRDEELPVSNDTWVLADASVPAVVSDQVQLGIETFWGDGWSASIEAYLRRFDGVTEFNLADDPNDPADDLLAGDGRSRGLDLLLRQSSGKLTGWATLSLLRATRSFPNAQAAGWDDVPQEITYPPIFDRRIKVDIVAQYVAESGLEIGGRWNYGSGIPYTRPIGQYLSWRHHPLEGQAEPYGFESGEDGLPLFVLLGKRNAERYPAYHRLDVTVRRPFERSWGTYVPYLQVLNVYNRRNVLFYFYDYNKAPPVRSGFSMFPILPAIGVEVTF